MLKKEEKEEEEKKQVARPFLFLLFRGELLFSVGSGASEYLMVGGF